MSPTTVTILEEEVLTSISVELVNDDIVEGNEVLFVRLVPAPNNASGVELTMDTATIVITDNDGNSFNTTHLSIKYILSLFVVAYIGFEIRNVTVQESSGEVTLNLVKTGLTAIQLAVIFTTQDLQATGI